jgi:hypothetical protein
MEEIKLMMYNKGNQLVKPMIKEWILLIR